MNLGEMIGGWLGLGRGDSTAIATQQTDAAAERGDGYYDILSGSDPSANEGSYYVSDRRMMPDELAALYEDDAIAARIVDRVVDDAIRAEWDLVGIDTAYNWKSAKSAVDDHDAIAMIGDAWRFARLQGGGLLVMAVGDGRPFDQPLDLANAKALRGLSVLDSTQVVPHGIDLSLGSSAYKRPPAYRVLEGALKDESIIHASRVIRFDGVSVPPRRLAQYNGWGPSVLQRCKTSLYGYRTALKQALGIGKRLSTIMLKAKNWRSTAAASPEEQSKLQQYLRQLFRGLNAYNLLAIDKEDELVEVKRSMEGVQGLIEVQLAALVADSDATRQIITGQQTSTGLNSDTKGEWRSWYDRVTVARRLSVECPLTRVLEVEFAIRRNRGEQVPSEWTIEWSPLEQEAQSDVAARAVQWVGVVASMIASGQIKPHEGLQILIDRGIVDETELEAAKVRAPTVIPPSEPDPAAADDEETLEGEEPNETDLAWESPTQIGDAFGLPPQLGHATRRAIDAAIRQARVDEAPDFPKGSVMVRVPDRLAKLFPFMPGHSAPPHVTLLFCGPLTWEEHQELREIVAKQTVGWQSVRARFGGLNYFEREDGGRVAWVAVEFEPALAQLHERLKIAVQSEGVPVKHRSGPWVPHATLAYLDAGEEFTGLVPIGEWTVENLEVWYGEERG